MTPTPPHSMAADAGLAPTRACGTCTLCCKVMAVQALDKPVGAWCQHCAPGRGCKIHETRPSECRAFNCLWLGDPKFPENLRPDRTKVVFVLEAGGGRIAAYVDPSQPAAWRQGEVYSVLKRLSVMAAETRRQVVVFVRDAATAILPDRDVPLGPVHIGQQIIYSMKQTPDGPRIEPRVEALPPPAP
jgi:hypothetical protein